MVIDDEGSKARERSVVDDIVNEMYKSRWPLSIGDERCPFRMGLVAGSSLDVAARFMFS